MTNRSYCKQTYIHYLAPTLCGIKPANLFTISSDDFSQHDFEEWQQVFRAQNLGITAFDCTSSRVMVFSYNNAWIRQILGKGLVQEYLITKGYADPMNTADTMNELFYRLKTQKGFPHEVGIFLGYPLDDVITFEQNEGRNCKYCGYWKSYSDPVQARICCAQYRTCSKMCRKWFEEGLSVPQIIQKYKKAAEQAA